MPVSLLSWPVNMSALCIPSSDMQSASNRKATALPAFRTFAANNVLVATPSVVVSPVLKVSATDPVESSDDRIDSMLS
jgi:hypothetical protein